MQGCRRECETDRDCSPSQQCSQFKCLAACREGGIFTFSIVSQNVRISFPKLKSSKLLKIEFYWPKNWSQFLTILMFCFIKSLKKIFISIIPIKELIQINFEQ